MDHYPEAPFIELLGEIIPLQHHQRMSDREWTEYYRGRNILKQAIEQLNDWRNFELKQVCISSDMYKPAFNQKVKYYLKPPQWPNEPEIWDEDAFKKWLLEYHSIMIQEHFEPQMFEPEYYLFKVSKP